MGLDKGIMTCVHYSSIVRSIFPALQILCAHSSLPTPLIQAIPDLFTVSIVWDFPECHRLGTMQHIAPSDWLFSPLGYMHLVSSVSFLGLIAHFFFMLTCHHSGCATGSWSVHPPTEGHHGCYQVRSFLLFMPFPRC